MPHSAQLSAPSVRRLAAPPPAGVTEAEIRTWVESLSVRDYREVNAWWVAHNYPEAADAAVSVGFGVGHAASVIPFVG